MFVNKNHKQITFYLLTLGIKQNGKCDFNLAKDDTRKTILLVTKQ